MNEPVENLRGRQWGVKVVIALAIVGAVGIGIAIIKLARHDSDPGGDACDHVREIVGNDASANEVWDARVRAAGRALARRVVEMTVTGTKELDIDRGTTDETCRELFRAYYSTSMYQHFERLTGCVGKAMTLPEVSRCLQAMGL